MPKLSGCFVSALRFELVDALFARFHRQLAEEGYVARAYR